MSNQNETTPNPKPPNRNEPLDENQTFDAVPSIDDLISEKQSEDHSENANFDQTIDLSQSVPAKADPTMDLDSLSDQTVEFSVDQSDGGTSASVSLPNAPLDEISISEMGTMILPKEQAPFGGTVLLSPSESSSDAGTNVLPSSMSYDQTMDLSSASSASSEMRKSSDSGRSDRYESGTIPLDSQSGSSGLEGRSSNDQTLDLTDQLPGSKGESTNSSRSNVNSVSAGQSNRASVSGAGNSRSMGESRQYIQAPRAEASDAIFSRITKRQVSELIELDDERADYQIRKKIDPKTGRLGLHILGEGGMGLVYFATQNAVKRPVALKMIRKEKRTDNLSKQFFFEAEITAQLEHPNITPIYELGKTEDGVYFYSMKYIQGTPWEKKIRTNSLDENLEIFDKLCDAIAFAHSKDIIHMDIKPDNVVLGEYGEVYAVDWGVASDLKRPDPVRVAGTFQWISPEVAKGDKALIGKGSDIYLLGGILYLVVTGHHPRLPKDETAKLGRSALVAAAQNNIIQPTDCSDPMLKVALKALATHPADRYTKVEDMQEAIQEIQKERARIKSSLELTERSEALAIQANSSSDYDQYYRSLYGYRDAIEFWSNNSAANLGLKKVRYDFGRCAFEQGDYDLALQILDTSEPAENQLRGQVEDAKRELKLRKARMRRLVTAFIASLLIGSTIVGYLAWVATNAKALADANAQEAKDNLEIAVENENKAKTNEDLANKNANLAKENEKKAVENETRALESEKQAKESERIAVEARKQEEAQKRIAVRLQEQAEKDLAGSQIDYITRQLGLARARINEKAPSGGAIINDSIDTFIRELVNDAKLSQSSLQQQGGADKSGKVDSNLLVSKMPKLDHWARERINYLTNIDLKPLDLRTSTSLDADKSAIAYSPTRESLLVANPDGSIFHADLANSNKDQGAANNQAKQVIGAAPNPLGRIQRIIPSTTSNELFELSTDPKNALLKIDENGNRILLSSALTKGSLDFDSQSPGELVVSPNGKHLAVSYPNHVFILETSPSDWYLSHPVNSEVLQIAWLNDQYLLTLFNNDDDCYLDLVRLALDSKIPDESGPRVIARLAINAKRFVVLNEDSAALKNALDDSFASDSVKDDVQANLQSIMENLRLLLGTSEGELVQSSLRLANAGSSNVFKASLVNKTKLPKKHLHSIDQILISPKTASGGLGRRLLTRTESEEAVQVWSIRTDDTLAAETPAAEGATGQADSASIEHITELTGFPVRKSGVTPDNRFACWSKSGDVILSNAQFQTVQLNIDEQVRRKKLYFDTAKNSEGDRFAATKWLFESLQSASVTRVDSNGVLAVSNTKNEQQSEFQRNSVSQIRISQALPQLLAQGSKGANVIDEIRPLSFDSVYQYYGHSPYAKIVHAATNPEQTRLISIATVPRGRDGYFSKGRSNGQSAMDAAKDAGPNEEHQELCLWDLTTNQFIDRLVIQSKATNLRLFPLDSNRFLLGNSASTTVIEIGSQGEAETRFLPAMQDTPVFLAASNPKFSDANAFFRVDGDGGTLWIGGIPTQSDKSEPQWFDINNNRFKFRGAVPIAACWSFDGLRLYVLEANGQIERFEFDPSSKSLSVDRSEQSQDLIQIPREGSPDLIPLLDRPSQVRLGLSQSISDNTGTWRDELIVARTALERKGNRTESVYMPVVSVVFSNTSKPAIGKVDSENAIIKFEQKLAMQIQALTNANLRNIGQAAARSEIDDSDCSSIEDSIYTPYSVSANATGNLAVMHWGNSTLICQWNDDQVPQWTRLENQWEPSDQFQLSPDGNRLAVLGKQGLKLFSLSKAQGVGGDGHSTFTLSQVSSGLADDSSVRNFVWKSSNATEVADPNTVPFAVAHANGSIEYFDGKQVVPFGNTIRVATETEDKVIDLSSAKIMRIDFFHEKLSDIQKQYSDDQRNAPTSGENAVAAVQGATIDKEYISVCYDTEETQTQSLLFVDLDTAQPANGEANSTRNAYFQTNADFQNLRTNPNGSLFATSSCSGEVNIYLVSPYWNTLNDVFIANTDIDSGIIQITFADQGKTLVVSNTNRQVFGLRTQGAQ